VVRRRLAGQRGAAGDVCRRNPFRAPGGVADSTPCGPDLDAIVDAVGAYWAAGFADVALIQIGGEAQELFFEGGRRTAAGGAARRREIDRFDVRPHRSGPTSRPEVGMALKGGREMPGYLLIVVAVLTLVGFLTAVSVHDTGQAIGFGALVLGTARGGRRLDHDRPRHRAARMERPTRRERA
jgi:hypothetical protein